MRGEVSRNCFYPLIPNMDQFGLGRRRFVVLPLSCGYRRGEAITTPDFDRRRRFGGFYL